MPVEPFRQLVQQGEYSTNDKKWFPQVDSAVGLHGSGSSGQTVGLGILGYAVLTLARGSR